MGNREISQDEFFSIAKKKGLTNRQILTLRSNRLFPRTVRKGLGRGKGWRFFYPEKAVKDLETLVYWKSHIRSLQDLRWTLWLFGEWDWLWDDVRVDLLKMFPKSIPKFNNIDLLAPYLTEGRYKLFNKSLKQTWSLVGFSIVVPFVTKKISNGVRLSEIKPGDQTLVYPEDMNKILGSGSYQAYQYLQDRGIFSLLLWKNLLEKTTVEKAKNLREKLQVIEKDWDNDPNLKILKKILGIRPLRKYGLQRLPRTVSVCIFLVLQDKEILVSNE